MSSEERLDELVLLWEERYLDGDDVPPEGLCRDHPELTEALRERIGNLKAVARFMGADSAEGTTPLSREAAARHQMRSSEQPSTDYVGPSQAPSLAELLPARYKLIQEVGSGGMGLVLRVHDTTLDRELALKVLPADDRSELSARRFRTEARITSQLQHPGIPPVHDIGQLRDGQPFFTMRLVQGSTLAELLRKRADPQGDLEGWLRVFEQVCQTVAYAHSQHVIHRDLKPQNIMVGAFGEVQVMDWGLAKALSKPKSDGGEAVADVTPDGFIARFRSTFARLFHREKRQGDLADSRTKGAAPERPRERNLTHEEEDGIGTVEGAILGSPAYMSPEQARGEVSRIDERSDVFGLGAILCEVLTGKPLFVGTAAEARELARKADLAGVTDRLTACGADEELVTLARACLQPERDHRLPNAGEVARAMQRYRERMHQRLLHSEQQRGAAAARVEEEQKRAALLLGAVSLVARTIEERNEHIPGHTYRVSSYAVLLASRLGLTAREVELIRVGTLLRDIGKIGMDDAILRKPIDQLSKEELALLKSHTERGAKLVSKVPELREVHPIVRSHHERWDGEGYPDGLPGEKVSIVARVVALADAFDVLTSDRPFGMGLTADAAFDVIERNAGTQFDPRIVDDFLSIREPIVQGMRAFELAMKPSERKTVILQRPTAANLDSAVAASHATPSDSPPEPPPSVPVAGHTEILPTLENPAGCRIRLRGMNGPFKGQTWEATDLLRIGRLEALEIVLDVNSVSRYHAEIRATDRGWRVRDLGSTNGSRLNGVRLGNGQWPLSVKDLLQFGEIAVVVEAITEDEQEPESSITEDEQEPESSLMPGLHVAGRSKASWDDAVAGMALSSTGHPREGDRLRALLMAGHHLSHIENEQDLLQSILNDAVNVLDAQRGAIVLAEPPNNRLEIRALTTGRAQPRATMSGRDSGERFQFSNTLANRCFSRGESILCHRMDEDPELAMAKSTSLGSMASAICVLLRSPRQVLGVLHLDRSPWQRPFTMDDLHLADALAAHVSIGIDCVRSLRGKTPSGRALLLSTDLFLDTITVLAQAMELRDDHTGGHTYRVTTYSTMLAEHINLVADDLKMLRVGTPLHDIGKIGIDESILRKPGPLTQEEFEIMKTHTVNGDEILSTIPDLNHLRPIVRSHHERWDGKGYPDQLRGEAISPLARVVALADAFDAMTTDRPYRKAMPVDLAFAEIEKQAGEQFDPAFVAAFLAIKEQITQKHQSQTTQQSTTRKLRVAIL